MATLTPQERLKKVQGGIQRLLTTPASQLTPRELKLLNVALPFGSCYDFEVRGTLRHLETRDLKGLVSTQNFEELLDMLCMVDSYNEYEATKVVKVLEKHKDFIDVHSGCYFGRESSPVLYLSLKQYYMSDGGSHLFMEKAIELGKDLKRSAGCDELHWCMFGKNAKDDFNPRKGMKEVKAWGPIWDKENPKKVLGYEEKSFDHFRTFRVWWD
jgi:hypothetical protein